jgi:hypothetical protein
VRTTIGTIAPWLLPGGAVLLDAANLLPPPAMPVQVLLCAIAVCVTVSVVVRREVAAVARQAPVAQAMQHGYQLARKHCLDDHGVGQHLEAVGQSSSTTTFGLPALRLVSSAEGTVYRSGSSDPATAAHPLVHRASVPSPRPLSRHRRR